MEFNKYARDKKQWGYRKSIFSCNPERAISPPKERHEKMENPNYYSIIPADVRYDTRLTPNSKLLYAEITALANMNGKCFATNDYFAKLYCVSKTSISKWVSQLVEFGYIQSEIIYKDGSKEIEKRYLTILKYPPQEKFNTPPQEKFKDNNTTIVEYNNTLTESKIREALEKWIAYKKERKQSYKPTGLKACVEKLERLSNNNPDLAMRIVDESISNNWSGLFPLKNNKTKAQTTDERNWEIIKNTFGLEEK